MARAGSPAFGHDALLAVGYPGNARWRALLMLRVRPQTYIDTSVWCAFCFNELEVPGARDWLAQASLDHAATAVWTRTEFASAAALKRRAKGQSAAQGMRVLANGV